MVVGFVIAYLLGNFTAGYIISRFFYGQDIRSKGSGNVGATNALRVLGKKAGALTLLLDCLKGIVAVYIGGLIGGSYGNLLASLGVVLGHMFPIFFGFRGGKGIATSLGVLLALDYKMALVLLSVFIITVALSRMVSLGSVLAALSSGVYAAYYYFNNDKMFVLTILIIASLVVIKHIPNIKRIINGEESRLGR